MMTENHYHKRLEELSEVAQEHIEAIPTEISHDEVMSNPDYKNHFHLYEECIEQINAIKQELEYGKVIPID